MLKSTAKAEAWMRDLKDKLSFRIYGSSLIDTIEELKDSDGYPMLKLSDGGAVASGDSVVLLRITQIDAVSKNVLGMDVAAAAPHRIEVAYELDINGKPVPSQLDLAKINLEVYKLGIAPKIVEIANGTAVSETSLEATNPALELQWDITKPQSGM